MMRFPSMWAVSWVGVQYRRKPEFRERGEQFSAMELVQIHREIEKDYRSDSPQCRPAQHCLFQFPTLPSPESMTAGVKKRQSVDRSTLANPLQFQLIIGEWFGLLKRHWWRCFPNELGV
jgi:hypothetical protein